MALSEAVRVRRKEQRALPETRARTNARNRLLHTKPETWAAPVLYRAKHRAEENGIEFDLVPEDIVIPAVCPVLGTPIVLGGGRNAPNAPSIDRFDNSKGYTKDNIRIISYRANGLKSNATLAEMEKVLEYMRGQI